MPDTTSSNKVKESHWTVVNFPTAAGEYGGTTLLKRTTDILRLTLHPMTSGKEMGIAHTLILALGSSSDKLVYFSA
ncbi:hypothetical protein llap_10030 [Limosa lapponica baueri]|uniref:Uncharacterized protein n=1 Tax=Limosa lapponica baueri TaxID=1758121 RepID=A0A2I0U0P5_LIMLA|nr:hypothetical protein llap_10030 [Limosa lapponica baueri]